MPDDRLQRTREAYLGTKHTCRDCGGVSFGEDIHQCPARIYRDMMTFEERYGIKVDTDPPCSQS